MVDVADDVLALANELRPVVLRLARHLRTEIERQGLTGAEVSLLVAIDFHPGIAPQKLAEREALSTAAISGHLARLEGRDLIRRERSSDGRHVALFLTSSGQARLVAVRESRNSWLAGRLGQLTADDRHAIRNALDPLGRVGTGER